MKNEERWLAGPGPRETSHRRSGSPPGCVGAGFATDETIGFYRGRKIQLRFRTSDHPKNGHIATVARFASTKGIAGAILFLPDTLLAAGFRNRGLFAPTRDAVPPRRSTVIDRSPSQEGREQRDGQEGEG